MTARSSRLVLSFAVFVGIALAACDGSAEGTDLPEAASSQVSESVTSDSSMAQDSPAGEGVSAEEIPHSDVPPPSRAVFTDSECDFEGWVGKPVDEAAIKATGRPNRIMAPGAMMTMDHSPQRVNVEHDKDMKVTRVWCG